MNRWVDVVWRGALGLWPLVLCLALPAAATPTLEQEQEIRTTFATPHTKWAKPYVGGTTRVLFFSDYKNTQAREIVELIQRFDVRADAAYYTRVRVAKKPQMQWHGGEEGIARIRRLLDSGAHDVFLFNGVSPDVLPAALKQDLLARVRGKGLVRLGERFRELDTPLLVEWPDGRRAALLFVVEEETQPGRFSIHRLAHYCLDLAELLDTERVVPVVSSYQL